MKKQKLMIEQLNYKFNQLKSISESFIIPSKGWIYTVRKSLNISLRQLSKKLNRTPQNVNQLEIREKNGTISLNKLREVAACMDMELVYAFVPIQDSLEKMLEQRSYELAKKIVLRTSHTMSIEDQENLPERIEKAIQEKAEQLKNELPRYFWD